MDLAEILSPLEVPEFLAGSYGKELRLVPGHAGKFADVFTWSRLNAVLRLRHAEWTDTSDDPRISLALDGKRVPLGKYTRIVAPGERRADPSKVNHLLRRGATLVVKDLDRYDESVAELAELVEQRLREPVRIAAVASWGTSPGFGLHIDMQDGLILQVAGRKHWAVYGETTTAPLGDGAPAEPPTGDPLWEGDIADGDFLYVPRGWWHDVVAKAEPSLHLTINVFRRTGVDVLRWLTGELHSSAVVRSDVPRFASTEERAAYAARLRSELVASLGDGFVDRFLEACDAAAAPDRPRFSFPSTATRAVLPDGDARLRLVAPRGLVSETTTDGGVEFVVAGQQWRLTAAERRALQPLFEQGECRLADVIAAADGSAGRIRETVVDLVLGGLVAVD